jgi:hypothetical protein
MLRFVLPGGFLGRGKPALYLLSIRLKSSGRFSRTPAPGFALKGNGIPGSFYIFGERIRPFTCAKSQL